MTGRGTLGKFIMIIFILFNLIMLCLSVLAYKMQTASVAELRADLLARAITLGKETRDDRTLNNREIADIEKDVDDIVGLLLYVRDQGIQSMLIMWAIGFAVTGVLLYYTRPQPI